jgi:hypothetical protein
MNKRAGEYKSPQERALQVCYPNTLGGDTRNRSKGTASVQFKIKDRKIPMDEQVARRALQEVRIDCNNVELLHNLEKGNQGNHSNLRQRTENERQDVEQK